MVLLFVVTRIVMLAIENSLTNDSAVEFIIYNFARRMFKIAIKDI